MEDNIKHGKIGFPPLLMKDHFFKKVKVELSELNQKENPENKPFDYDFQFSTKIQCSSSDENDILVELNARSIPKKDFLYGWDFDITVLGFFKYIPTNDPKDKEIYLNKVAPHLLIGVLREFVYLLTSRGPIPSIYLPTIQIL